MRSYNVHEVERVLRLTRSTIRGLVNAGFVKPERGARREYRFSFRDLIVLRTARALIDAKVPRKRIHRSLEDLRRHLPEAMDNGVLHLVERPRACATKSPDGAAEESKSAEQWFAEGLELEGTDAPAARRAYEQAV